MTTANPETRILDAASQLFGERGYAGTTTRQETDRERLTLMKYAFVLFLVLNALVSAMGFAKAFDLMALPQLQPISQPVGLLWLVSALCYLTAAGMLVASSRRWWVPAAAAIIFSTVVIVLAWGDAKWGMLANLVVLVPVVIAALSAAPWNYRALYSRDIGACSAASAGDTSVVTEADLVHLPDQIQRYLRFAGVVGKPRVRDYRIVFDGALRSGPDKPFMTGLIEQHSFASPPARLFLAHMSMYGIPAEAFHRYVGPSATFNVKIASLAHIVNESGLEMNRAETVTLFNDMVLLAPATLIDASIEWEELAPDALRATWSNAGNTVSADLSFDEFGALANFVSADRARSGDLRDLGVPELDPGSAVGSANRLRWSTPIGGWKELNGRKLPVGTVAVWHLPQGDFVYGKFEIVEIEFNAAD